MPAPSVLLAAAEVCPGPSFRIDTQIVSRSLPRLAGVALKAGDDMSTCIHQMAPSPMIRLAPTNFKRPVQLLSEKHRHELVREGHGAHGQAESRGKGSQAPIRWCCQSQSQVRVAGKGTFLNPATEVFRGHLGTPDVQDNQVFIAPEHPQDAFSFGFAD